MEPTQGRDRLSVSPPTYDGTTCRVRVAGDLDAATCSTLEQVLTPLLTTPELTRLELDLAAVAYIDLAGLRLLVHTRRALAERGATVVISDCSPMVRQVLAHSSVNTLFEVLP